MSRSYRKNPYFTDQQGGDTKLQKRAANRAVRSLPKDAAPAKGKQYRKESCSWNIRDWSFYDPKNPKAKRK